MFIVLVRMYQQGETCKAFCSFMLNKVVIKKKYKKLQMIEDRTVFKTFYSIL